MTGSLAASLQIHLVRVVRCPPAIYSIIYLVKDGMYQFLTIGYLRDFPIIFKTSNKPNLHGPTSNYDVDVLNAVSNHPKKVLQNILKITY